MSKRKLFEELTQEEKMKLFNDFCSESQNKLFEELTQEEKMKLFNDFCSESQNATGENRDAIKSMLSDPDFLKFVTHHANSETELTELTRDALSNAVIGYLEYANKIVDTPYLDLLSSISVDAINSAPNGKLITPLCRAADYDQGEAIEILVKNGADINVCSDKPHSISALQMASYDRSYALEKLIQLGATIDFENNQGDTALMIASGGQSSYSVGVLIKAGADINHRNKENKTALSLACGSFFGEDALDEVVYVFEIALMLIKLGAEVDYEFILNDLERALEDYSYDEDEQYIINFEDEDLNIHRLDESNLLYNLIEILDAAKASDALLDGETNIPTFHAEYKKIFFERSLNVISKSLDFTQYNKLKEYADNNGLDIANIVNLVVDSLLNIVNKGIKCEAKEFESLGDSMIISIFNAFVNRMHKDGLQDYDSAIAAIEASFLPEYFIKNIVSLLCDSRVHLDVVESVLRGEFENISIIPAVLVEKYVEGDDCYQTNQATFNYYMKNLPELYYVGAYFKKLNSTSVIEKIRKLDPMVIEGIKNSLEMMNDKNVILLSDVKKAVQKCIDCFNEYDFNEQEAENSLMEIEPSGSSEVVNLKRLLEEDDRTEGADLKSARVEEDISESIDVIGEHSDLV